MIDDSILLCYSHTPLGIPMIPLCGTRAIRRATRYNNIYFLKDKVSDCMGDICEISNVLIIVLGYM